MVSVDDQKNRALDHIEFNVAKYNTPNIRSELRAGDVYKRTITCRESGCKFSAFITLIGKVHKFKEILKIIGPKEAFWVVMYHEDEEPHLVLTDPLLL